jgi:hypothetical protein
LVRPSLLNELRAGFLHLTFLGAFFKMVVSKAVRYVRYINIRDGLSKIIQLEQIVTGHKK